MPDIQLIAMDMDGTLLEKNLNTFPPENVAALREAADRGIHLAICSGRLADDSGFFAAEAGLPMYIISLNGGCVAERPLGKILWNRFMPDDMADKLVSLLLDSGLTFGLFGEHRLQVANGRTDKLDTKMWGSHLNQKGSRVTGCFDRDNIPNMMAQGISKAVVMDDINDGALNRLADAVSDALPELNITSSWYNNLEINAPGTDKGSALMQLADYLHIDRSAVMAMGDHDNDITMLKAAGVGVAMGNASPGALDAADVVTVTNTQHGVARAIRAIALGQAVEGVRWLR